MAHVKGGRVSVHMAVVNHLAERVHHGDVIDAWCNNVHIVRSGVGIDRDRFVALVDPVVAIDINTSQPAVDLATDLSHVHPAIAVNTKPTAVGVAHVGNGRSGILNGAVMVESQPNVLRAIDFDGRF